MLTPLKPKTFPLLNPTAKCSPWCLMWLICSTCVHSQIHLHYMCKIYSQSVQPFDHISKAFELLTPLKPAKCPLVYPGAICLAYIHSHKNLHMCAKFGANRPSRLVAFPEYVLRLVRLFAAVRADSRKNTPKNNIYTSKIIIPART